MTEDTDPVGLTWEERIREFYKEYNPEKERHVDALLKKFAGQENDLWDALQDKYVLKRPKPGRGVSGSPSPSPGRRSVSKGPPSSHIIATVTKDPSGSIGFTCEGPLITSVTPSSPAAAAGLAPGMTLLTINSTPVTRADSISDLIAASPDVFTLSARHPEPQTPPKSGSTSTGTSDAATAKQTVASQSKTRVSKKDTTWAERDFWPPAEPKFVAKKIRTSPSPGRKGYSATPKREEGRDEEEEVVVEESLSPEVQAVVTPRRFKEQRKPSVPRLSAQRGRSAPRKSTDREAAGTTPRQHYDPLQKHRSPNASGTKELVKETGWVSVMTQGIRGPLTAMERFEASLQEKGERTRCANEHAKKILQEEEKLVHIEERILKEDAVRARRLESKITEWEDLLAKKEHVRAQRARAKAKA